MNPKYTREDLFSLGKPRPYSGEFLREISFPLGGIGTGSVGLTGRGSFRDWEIFNRPNHGSWFPQTFPIIFAQEEGNDPVCRILEGPVAPPLLPLDGGKFHNNAEGLPHVEATEFVGEFPIARIRFHAPQLPVSVELEAYNPFVPSDPDASGYPAAILKYAVTNSQESPVRVVIAWSLRNLVGTTYADDPDRSFQPSDEGYGRNVNTSVDDENLRGLLFTSEKYDPGHPRFGSMALTTPNADASVMTYWPRAVFFQPLIELWETFSTSGALPSNNLTITGDRITEAGVVGIQETLDPGESKMFTFYLTWYFPNFEKYWASAAERMAAGKPITWRNYYAAQFGDALDVARKLHQNESALYEQTKKFHDALFGSTLPPYVLDAIASNLGIVKTATFLRLPDGTLYGFEGTNATTGCCEGSCTHVYNYEQVLAFLFPSLERGMREADYKYNFVDPEMGALNFRIVLPLGAPGMASILPCADGQMGDVIKVYRDWKIFGDDDWLRKMWPDAKRALEFAWVEWDEDKDGVMELSQHNTYDINFDGPTSMITSIYLGALHAAEEMARYLGEEASAAEYRRLYESGQAWVDENLFNGEYYFQQYDDVKMLKFQYGTGCLSDQVVGQLYSVIAGLGYILDPDHVRQALQSVFTYNWKPRLGDYPNPMRLYAANDEAGLLICTWPKGGRPKVPMWYADECMNGFEYQVATHCIFEGLLEEGLAIVKGIRDRYDGYRRNPWDEFECGHHYARSMASYGLLVALSGFVFDKSQGMLGFRPRISPDNFSSLWALDSAWGTYTQTSAGAEIACLFGEITLKQLVLPAFSNRNSLSIELGTESAAVPVDAVGIITLPEPAKLGEGQTLKVQVI